MSVDLQTQVTSLQNQVNQLTQQLQQLLQKGGQSVAQTTSQVTQQVAATYNGPNWSTNGSKIMFRGQEVKIRGTNMFGFETTDKCLCGLQYHSMDDLLGFVKNTCGFNAIRMPFALETIWGWDQWPDQSKVCDPKDKGQSIKQLMLNMAWKMKDLNMILNIDMHRLKITAPNNENGITPLWYDNAQGVTTDQVIDGWKQVATAFKDVPNVWFEIKNEPHSDDRGSATWGSGNASTDWDKAAVYISQQIATIKKDTLFLVEGVQNYGSISTGWGGCIAGYIDHPLPTDLNYVLTPHLYGTWVRPNYRYDPNNTWQEWQREVGCVIDQGKIPVVPTEWGAPVAGSSTDNIPQDMLQNAADWEWGISTWFNSKNIAGNFSWCTTKGSNDSGCIITTDNWDFNNICQVKVQTAAKAIPNPSWLNFN